MHLRLPTRIGRYELIMELARGGMGVLYLARRSGVGGFEKLVAIKLMLPHLSDDASHVALFLNEARITARISHPNICQVFEIEELDGQLVLVMEYLEGVTWEHFSSVLPPDPIERLRATVGVLSQACEGLQHAHELRDVHGTTTPVIHRDISPQNLFVTVDGVCKVLDFGVAKMVTPTSTSRSGVLAGKSSYMSPEQVRGERIDSRSDVFSTGVVLWEALAQRPLFLRDVEFETLLAITSGVVESVTQWEASYRVDVDAVVQRALARDRDHRYATIRELGGALREMADAFGGAMTQAELGALVRGLCGARLAERKREIAAASRSMIVADDARDVETDPTVGAARQRPQKGGIALRAATATLVRTRPKVRWRAIALVTTAAVAVGGIAVGLARSSSTTPTSPSLEANAVATSRPSDAAVTSPPSTDAVQTPVFSSPSSSSRAPSTPPRRPPPHTHRAPPRAHRIEKPAVVADTASVATDTRPGKLSVDARSVARVYIDGVFVDETPLYLYELAPGRHELRLSPKDGVAKVMRVTIEPGAVLNLGTIP